MKYFVAAYSTSPSKRGWDAEAESDYYAQLKSLSSVRGLEHPFAGKLHGHDDEWFLKNISPDWDYVFTCVPGIMGALSNDPKFGIASTDEGGRKAALDFMQSARDTIEKLTAHLGRQAVQAIEVQTAPSRTQASSSAEALTASLDTMLKWDWCGARIAIEHCDALVETHAPSKGFLALEDEIKVLHQLNQSSNASLGLVINWGRSVLEARSARGALNHIKQSKEAGLLAGLMFSGASSEESEYGVWKDTHMPPVPYEEGAFGAPESLLTVEEIHACLAECGDQLPEIVGIKLGIRPRDADVATRVACNKNALDILEAFQK